LKGAKACGRIALLQITASAKLRGCLSNKALLARSYKRKWRNW
jgi:hypothetical protein